MFGKFFDVIVPPDIGGEGADVGAEEIARLFPASLSVGNLIVLATTVAVLCVATIMIVRKIKANRSVNNEIASASEYEH